MDIRDFIEYFYVITIMFLVKRKYKKKCGRIKLLIMVILYLYNNSVCYH